MSASRLIELGQVVCGLLALVGLFMLLPLPVFLLVVGVAGLVLLTLAERVIARQPRTSTPGTEGA